MVDVLGELVPLHVEVLVILRWLGFGIITVWLQPVNAQLDDQVGWGLDAVHRVVDGGNDGVRPRPEGGEFLGDSGLDGGCEEPDLHAYLEGLLVLVILPMLPDNCLGEVLPCIAVGLVDGGPEFPEVLMVVVVASVDAVCLRPAEDDVEQRGAVSAEDELEGHEPR